MSYNAIPSDPDSLASLGVQAHQGALTHSATLDLGENAPGKLGEIITGIIGGTSNAIYVPGIFARYNDAFSLAKEAASTRTQAERRAMTFCGTAIDGFKGFFGRRCNPRWATTGFFAGSLALRNDPLRTLGELQAHMVAHPEHEIVTLGVTALAAEQMRATLIQARTEAERTKGKAKEVAAERKLALADLRRRLTALRVTLAVLLSQDDARWYDFGFKRPIDGKIPAMVEDLVLEQGLAGEIRVSWKSAVRAKNYRVTRQLPTDDEPVQVNLLPVTSLVIGGLPVGVEVTIQVTAVNKSGETQPATAKIVVQ